MGGRTSKTDENPGPPPKPEIGFDDFEVLRAIGRGSFGKVCLVENKSNKKVFAMKYVNKEACLKQNAVQNVISEVELLRAVDHPFVVSLWYTFQDAEDFFIILEPLLGGDMRFHMNGGAFHFTEEMVRFVCAEIGTALDFLRSRSIVHRDVKPDNILLDDAGHAHLTDFNVAACLKTSDKLAHTMAGTKPYMAPEIFYTAASGNAGKPGYSFAADWWSLGITAYELKTGRRPFEIHSRTSISSVVAIFNAIDQTRRESIYPPQWSPEFTKFIQLLLTINPSKRLSSVYEMKSSTKLMSNVNFISLMQKKVPPPFVPNQNVLNCDPTYELEEMIIEAKPLHKKKKRLLRQQTLLTQHPSGDKLSSILEANEEKCAAFPLYNREWERYQDALREKETEWEKELKQLMEKSCPVETKSPEKSTAAESSNSTEES